MKLPNWSPPWMRRLVNPGNRTRLHLADEIRKHGYVVGDHSYGAPRIRFGYQAKLTIGRYCSFADQIDIFLGGDHRTDFVTTFPFPAFQGWKLEKIADFGKTRGDVTIGNDVWVGAGATILAGVTIGDGAVIGARAVVARDVPAYAVVVGNPARVVKRRFDDETISTLIETAWWDLPDEAVVKLAPLIQSTDIAGAIAAIRAARAEHRL